jgi:hypothetical protein
MNRLEKITILGKVSGTLMAYINLLDSYNLCGSSAAVADIREEFKVFVNEFLDESYARDLKKEDE